MTNENSQPNSGLPLEPAAVTFLIRRWAYGGHTAMHYLSGASGLSNRSRRRERVWLLVEQNRSRGGTALGGTLYSDALSAPDGPGSTYVEMKRIDVSTITTAIATE